MTTRTCCTVGVLWFVAAAGAIHTFRGNDASQTPSGFPKRHPDEVQCLYDLDYGAYRAILPDGTDEIICENGVRRPLLLYSKMVIYGRHLQFLRFSESLLRVPQPAFPVVCTYQDTEDASPLIFSLATGEIFLEWQPPCGSENSLNQRPPDL